MPQLEERAEFEFDGPEQPARIHDMIRPFLDFSSPKVGLGNLQCRVKFSAQERNREPAISEAPIIGIAGCLHGELMGALDRGPRLLRAPSLRPLNGAGVVAMHLGANLPLFESLPNPLVLRQRREQRLCLGDLRHFRRWRKSLRARARGQCGRSAGRPVDW